MSKELLFALIGAGAAIVLVLFLGGSFLGYKLTRGRKVSKHADRVIRDEMLNLVIDVIVSNQNTLNVPDKAREAINKLADYRTSHEKVIALEAKKAKAKKAALKPKQVKKTEKYKLI